MDHGIETPAARAAAGKPQQAVVKLSVRRDGGRVVVSISDDGPGIDWAAIGERARQRGLPHGSRSDLEAALFSAGVSSRGEASSTSGRGIGLSAVDEEIRQLGGRIEIESAGGQGTTFRFVLPESMLLADGATPRAGGEAIPSELAAN